MLVLMMIEMNWYTEAKIEFNKKKTRPSSESDNKAVKWIGITNGYYRYVYVCKCYV